MSRAAPEGRHRVFVYGTLLRGLSNHGWLQGGVFVREDRTSEPLTLVDLGEYPATLEPAGRWAQGATPVTGEVWDVDDDGLARLDELEDWPTLYTRRPVPLRSGDTALVYVLNGEPEAHGMRGRVIAGGDYKSWLRSQSLSGAKTSSGA